MISNELNERILDAICDEKNVTKEMIFTGTRRRMYVEPRQIYQYILVNYYNVKTSYFETRDIDYGIGWNHSTIHNSIKSVESQIETNKPYRRSFNRIMSKIRGNITCPHCGAIIETK